MSACMLGCCSPPDNKFPLCPSLHLQEGLPAWDGSSLQDVLRSQAQLGSSSSNGSSSSDNNQQQQQQDGIRSVHEALVDHPTCFTAGLGLQAWQYEGTVTATAAVHVASQRNQGMYGFNGPR